MAVDPTPNLSRVDLNLFVVFDAIYRERNLTRAAESLHLTQPAISHSLAKLREKFDDVLFERSGKLMKPTPLANTLIDEIRSGLGSFEKILFKNLNYVPEKSNRSITFAMRDVLQAASLPDLIKYYSEVAPNIRINSIRLTRNEIESSLANGKIDFALDINIPVSKQIRRKKVGEDFLVAIVRKNHPMLNSNSELSIDDYLQGKHVLISSRIDGMGVEDHILSKLGHNREIAVRCQNYYAANLIVSQSDLILTIPQTYAELLISGNENVLLPLPFPQSPIGVYLYWLAKAESDPAIHWFIPSLIEQLQGIKERLNSDRRLV